MERNVIAKSTVIIGEVKADGDFRIDGTLEGNIAIKGKIIIGVTGAVKGDIVAAVASIEGESNGNLQVAKTLTVKSSAKISGHVIVGKLSIEPGADFNASCEMKGDVKNMDDHGKKSKLKQIFK